ncbi:hypothetical protein IWW38_002468 [Coemansia aciculifera]|uniref:Uncharacterized protein n=1 Tax=Coemansia aciculifera TaxID=417176 RepID=A0ACC1M553_9FUNG|nr:hypothetical protein IWW38_002468 [Coemansia aciculifera]
MAKHEFMTAKAASIRIKAKGLQRLRWYCQMCEKQCRDQNGFKCHCASEAHQRQMSIFAESPARYVDQFSQEFEQVFLSILSRRYGTKQVNANQVYQEIIADRQHLHMNATKWDSLSDFAMYLGREGKCRVEDSERGWLIEWIDNSPEALARRAAISKKERQEMDDEQREQMLLQEQIQRAQKSLEAKAASSPVVATDLKRESTDQPIKLAWKVAPAKESGVLKPNRLKATSNLARPNPFKAALATQQSSLSKQTPTSSITGNDTHTQALKPRPSKPTAVEEIMRQELLRKGPRGADSVNRRRSRSPDSSSYRSTDRDRSQRR